MTSSLERGRDAFQRRHWGEAYALMAEADREAALPPSELEPLAMAAFLIGKDAESVDLLTRAHQAFLECGDTVGAARAAFWLFYELYGRGDRAASSGWAARGRRLLDEGRHECAERGYLLMPVGLAKIAEHDFAGAHEIFAEAARIGERYADRNLVALSRQGAGRTLLALGERARGLSLLDEAMVAVTTGEIAPAVTGTVYCSVLEACFEIFDLARAQEWTGAFGRWCASQPDLAPYRGQCLVRRTEVFVLRGRWAEALEGAREAVDRLSQPPPELGALASAHYQIGEIHRLRGDFEQSDRSYRLASASGRSPQPGLALLSLALGRADAAKAAICRVLDESRDSRVRSRLLGPAVEILLATGEAVAAERAATELDALAVSLDAPLLQASARYTLGRVLLGSDDARGALAAGREACAVWREIDVPYHAARAGVLVGLACRELGDIDGAILELDAAKAAFERLGAAPDVAFLERLGEPSPPPRNCPLTTRELQVLRLVASGRTNRDIAGQLDISHKTVARHISNIFTKLDISSRSAATAYAFQNDLM